MKGLTTLMVVMSFAILGGCSTTTARTHPDIEAQLKAVKRVVIAPPEIEVTLITFTGENERITATEETIRREVLNITKRELEAGGYEVVDFDFAAAKQQDETLATLITDFVTGYDNAKEELQHGKAISLEEAKNIRASLGEVATRVAAAAEADAVVLVRFGGFEKSEGQIAKDVGTSLLIGVISLGTVIPIQPTSGAFTEVALIDGYSGDILWTDIRGGALSSELTDMLLDQLPDDIDDAVVADSVTDPVITEVVATDVIGAETDTTSLQAEKTQTAAE
ncbi:MAG: hypothetical protein IPG64_05115 [Haliea sp.]|nr:hypothetical protein [Haliea sp.]